MMLPQLLGVYETIVNQCDPSLAMTLTLGVNGPLTGRYRYSYRTADRQQVPSTKFYHVALKIIIDFQALFTRRKRKIGLLVKMKHFTM